MQCIIGKAWDCIPHPAPNNHSTEICKSLLSACPAFCCRSLRKLFLPDASGVLTFLGALLSWRHFSGKLYWLAADDSVVKEHGLSILELGKAHFARYFQNLHRFFAFSANRNPQGRFDIQFFEIFKISHAHDAEHRGCEMKFIEPIGRNRRFCMRVWGAESPSRCPTQKAQMGFRVTPGESCPATGKSRFHYKICHVT